MRTINNTKRSFINIESQYIYTHSNILIPIMFNSHRAKNHIEKK